VLKKLINAQSKTITSAAIVIGALSLVSRILGIFRDRILASEFGAGDVLDVYYAAFRLPDLIFNLIVLGAISAGLIPVFTGLLGQFRKKKAWKVVNSLLNILVLSLIIVSILLFIFTPWVMRAMTPGFTGEKFDLVVALTRIMYLSPIFLAVSAILGSVLQSFKKFFAYALAPIFYNIGIIIGALYFVKIWGIYGLAYGVVLGAILHMLVQIWPVRALGFRYKFGLNLKDKYVREIGGLMIPRTLTLVMNQINILIVTVVASTLAAGSLAIFNLSNNLQGFPLGIFGFSFAIAALPTLSILAVKKKMGKFVETISMTFRQVLFFMVPASVLIYVLRAQIVRIILGSGKFDWLDTRLTAASLAIFAFSLFAQALIPLLVRGFYALHNSKTPFYMGLASLVVNIVSLLFFRWIFGFVNDFSFTMAALLKVSDLVGVADLRILALPFAITVSSIFNLVVLLVALRKHIGNLDGYRIMRSTIRIVFAGLGAGLFSYGILRLIHLYVETETFLGITIQGALAGIVGLLGYWFLGYLLNMEEMGVFVASMRKKAFKLFRIKEAGIGEDVMS
jgi:putative peptidoglycan lipid II flippase